LNRNNFYLNPDLPVLSPWNTVQPANGQTWLLERNPYSVWVDTEGNQLPYIDSISHDRVPNNETLNLQAASGQYDLQDRHLDLTKLTVFVQGQKKSGYTIHLDFSVSCDMALRVNLTYSQDQEIGDWLRTADFRRALSLGIDRQAINQTFFQGLGTPSSIVPGSDNPYFPGESYRNLWDKHDPVKANQLLDGLGLTKKDSNGNRLRKDGTGPLQIEILATSGGSANFQPSADLIRQQWKEIGILADVRSLEASASVQRALANQVQLWAIGSGDDDVMVAPNITFPISTVDSGASLGIEYARWFQSGGSSGTKPMPEMVQIMNLWTQGRSASQDQRIKLGKQIWQIMAEEVFQIGVMGPGPLLGVRLVKDTLGNVPNRLIQTSVLRSGENGLPPSYYFKS
jgi:peptide/nickel transport system substrate-binding protein